jgi:hypothetical protein
MKQSDKKLKIYLSIVFIIGVFALVSQLYLTIANSSIPLGEIIIQYFSYFTILSNILVALCAAAILFNSGSIHQKFFSRPSTVSAVTVYITVVGLIYNIILREIWTPIGWQKITNELLHVIIPLLFLVFWIFFVPKQNLKWSILGWFIFPLFYAVYAIIRGAFSGFYPYPFMDVDQLGYARVLINCCGMVVVFVALSFLFVAIGKFLFPKRSA